MNDDLETTSTFSKTAWKNVVENTQATAIVFTANVNTTGMQNAYDLSVEKNRSILAWESNNTLYVASSTTGSKVYAPVDSSGLFAGLNTMTSIDVTGLDTSIVTNMSQMFMSFGKDATGKDVKILGLSTMSVRKTTNASQMFAEVGMNATTVYAPKLQSLEFKSTANVTDLTKNLGANATQIEIQ